MVTAADLGTAGNDATGNSYGIPSFARVANRAYIIFVESVGTISGTIPTLTGEGTWVRLAGGQFSSGGGTFYRIDAYGHQPTVSDAVTNVTIDYGGIDQIGVSWSVVELTGVPNDSANNGAALWPSGNAVYDDTANTLQTSNTVGLPGSGGATVVGVAIADNDGTDLEGTWTQLGESLRTGPLRTLTSGFLNASDNSVVASVTGGTPQKIGMVGVAIVVTTASNITLPLIRTTPNIFTEQVILAGQTLPLPLIRTTPRIFVSLDVSNITPPEPPAPPVVTAPIDDSILLEPSETLGQRVDTIEWELLDKELHTLGRVFPSRDDRATIEADIDRPIQRTLRGVTLTTLDAAAINPLTDRLRPWLRLQNGSRFPLGVYLFGDHQRSVSTRLDTWQPQMYDQGLILGDKLDRTISLPIGVQVQTIIVQMLLEVGITNFELDTSTAVTMAPIAWSAGTERSRVIYDLAAQMGCLQPFFDNMGTFRCVMAPDPATAVPQFSYGKKRIDADSIVEADDSYRAPNRYTVVGSGTTDEISGYYDIPAAAPHSYANRGYLVSDVIDMPGIENSLQAVLAARAAYLADTRAWTRISFTSPVDPRLDLYSIIDYDSGIEETAGTYLEVSSTIELTSGGNHDHTLSRLWGPT